MAQNQKNEAEYYTIDLYQIFKALLQNVIIIVLVGILGGVAGFAYSSLAITPQYSSSVLLYVNNSSIDLGNTSFSINAGDISASQSLVKLYTEILKNRTTLERVAEKSELGYSSGQLNGMISAGAQNGTQIMRVTVTCADPYDAAEIANTIAEVLPIRITEIIDGVSMEVVDSAIPNTNKVSPSITKYTVIGFMLAVLIVAAIIAVITVVDDTIHDEDYIIKTYNYPILAKIPDLLSSDSKGYKYYKSKSPDTEQQNGGNQ